MEWNGIRESCTFEATEKFKKIERTEKNEKTL